MRAGYPERVLAPILAAALQDLKLDHFNVRLALLDGAQSGQRHKAVMSGGHAILDLAQSAQASAYRRDEAVEIRAGAALPRHEVERGRWVGIHHAGVGGVTLHIRG